MLMIREIKNGIFVQSGSYVQEQRTLLCGKKSCVLIDAPQYFDEAEELKAFAERETPGGVRMGVITHGHLDHIATLQAFYHIVVVSNSAAREYMLGKGQEELNRMKQDDKELWKIHQVVPSVTFSGEGSVFDDLGRTLRCIPSPGHSRDSQVIYLEDECVAFGGDTLSAVVPPYFPDGNSMALQESITRLANLGADILIPGHGPILYGDDIGREAGEAVKYLENLRHVVREAIGQGKKSEDLQREVTWEQCSDKPVPPEDMLKYHRENVSNIAGEITSEIQPTEVGGAWHV